MATGNYSYWKNCLTMIRAGTGITVDNSDPMKPIINATGGGGGGGIESVVAGDNVTVDDTDPLNPIINAGDGLPFKLIVFRLTVDEFGDSSISEVFNDTGRTASYDDNLNIQLSGSYVDNYFVKNKEYLYWNYNADTNIGIYLEDPIIVSFPSGYSVLFKIEIYE